MSNLNAQLQIRVTPEQRAKAHELAQREGMTLSDMVRELLGDKFKEVERLAAEWRASQLDDWQQRQKERAT